MSQVTLFDLKSKTPCRCWSPNPWKTRLVLNFKGIDYKTEWLEYPEIAPTLKGLGLEPNAEGMPYTIPTIILDDKPCMDSRKIANVLEGRFPTPSLHLDDPILARVEEQFGKMVLLVAPIFMPKTPRNLLNPTSAEYVHRTRSARFGMPLEKVEETIGNESAWTRVEPEAKKLAEIVKANGGPFCMGDTISYADFYVASFMQFSKCVGEGLYEHLAAFDPVFGQIHEALKPYFERDGH